MRDAQVTAGSADFDDMKAKILIADQSPAVTLVMRRHFEAAGHAVDVAHDGLDALEMGSTGGYDLALIDHFLPTMLGAEQALGAVVERPE